MTEGKAGLEQSNPYARFRELAGDSIRYWEPRRISYNAVLTLVVIAYFTAAWPDSAVKISVDSALSVFVLVVLANVFYCAAYVVDVFAQMSALRENWIKYRWLLFVVGTAFAAAITRFFALDFFSRGPLA